MGVSSSTESVAGPSVMGIGKGGKVGCLLHSTSGAWVLEQGEAVTSSPPLKAAAVIPGASPCSYCQGCQPAAALQNDSDVNQL